MVQKYKIIRTIIYFWDKQYKYVMNDIIDYKKSPDAKATGQDLERIKIFLDLEIKTQTLYSVRAYLCITHCHMSRMWSIAFKSLCTFESTIEHYVCI